MAEKGGKYLYAVIVNNKPHNLEGMVGIDEQGLKLVPYKDIAAVVSNVSFMNFDQFNKPALELLVAAHEVVNRKLAQDHDTVPMRFGMVVENEESLLDVLGKAYLQFITSLEKLAGKTEFVLEVLLDEGTAIQKVVKENPEIQELQKNVSQRFGPMNIASKIKLGRYIFETLASRRKKYIEDILYFLKNYYLDASAGKLFDKTMIMNYSLLVDKHKQTELELKVDELGQKCGGELRFKFIGPMPPYSFCNINLKLGNAEVVNNAKDILGLPEEITLAELKKAYRDLAAKYHPDKHGGAPDTEEQMKKIAAAYNILEQYCNNYRYSFREEDINKVLMVT